MVQVFWYINCANNSVFNLSVYVHLYANHSLGAFPFKRRKAAENLLGFS